MHIIAGDHLEHERPGELVEDGIRIVVGGRGHVAQTCFKKMSQIRTIIAIKLVEIIVLFKRGGFINNRPFPDTVTGPSPAPRDFLAKNISYFSPYLSISILSRDYDDYH